jgi:hypothetical protein
VAVYTKCIYTRFTSALDENEIAAHQSVSRTAACQSDHQRGRQLAGAAELLRLVALWPFRAEARAAAREELARGWRRLQVLAATASQTAVYQPSLGG